MPTLDDIKALVQRDKSKTILELDLTHEIVEHTPDHPLAKIGARNRPTLYSLLEALTRAAKDDHVAGLLVTVGVAPLSMGHVQELRDAITRFRESGKFAIAWSESLGEMGGGTANYYLATACDEVWLQPSGSLGLNGLAVETSFYAGVLEKAGVDYQVTKRHEYKTFANRLTETEFTDAHRESVEELLSSLYESIVEGIADRRERKVDEVKALVDAGPYTAKGALEAELVDALVYRDEAWSRARERVEAAGKKGGDAGLLFLDKYAKKNKPKKARKAPVIAMVHVDGGIVSGRGGYNPVLGGQTVGGDVVTSALRQASRDDDVKAVVLRVNSPGGSAVASDTIWREVTNLTAAGTPVIASMANVAASGGYYVSAGATKILAEPGTITGSIGVIIAIPVFQELATRLGQTWETTAYGERANLLSLRKYFSDDEQSKIDESIDDAYREFVTRVAEGRSMEFDDAERLARGRVWTGAQAKDRGLIDEFGGLREAFAEARSAAGIGADDPIRVRVLPKVPPLEALGLQTPDNSEHATATTAMSSMLGRTKVGQAVGKVGLGSVMRPEVLALMPALTVR